MAPPTVHIPDRLMNKFVAMLKEYPSLSGKSNTPEARQLRADAIAALRTRVKDEMNVKMSEGQMWKKIQNTKARVKRKAEGKEMGGYMELKPWELECLQFFKDDGRIKIVDVKGSSVNEFAMPPIKVEPVYEAESNSEEDEMSVEDGQPTMDDCVEHVSLDEQGILIDNSGDGDPEREGGKLPETEETRSLTTAQLRRLVLLEQLKYYRKKQLLADIKLRREMRRQQETEAAPSSQ